MHLSFRDIGAIIKKVKLEADGERGQLEEDEDIKSKSKTTQAIKLFSEIKTPVEVVIALDLPSDQVQAIYQEYWELDGMCRVPRPFMQQQRFLVLRQPYTPQDVFKYTLNEERL